MRVCVDIRCPPLTLTLTPMPVTASGECLLLWIERMLGFGARIESWARLRAREVAVELGLGSVRD